MQSRCICGTNRQARATSWIASRRGGLYTRITRSTIVFNSIILFINNSGMRITYTSQVDKFIRNHVLMLFQVTLGWLAPAPIISYVITISIVGIILAHLNISIFSHIILMPPAYSKYITYTDIVADNEHS